MDIQEMLLEMLVNAAFESLNQKIEDLLLYLRSIEQASSLKTLVERLTKNEGIIASTPRPNTFRVYSPEECCNLDLDCRSLLMFLERKQIITHSFREMLIAKIETQSNQTIDVAQLSHLILLLLEEKEVPNHAWMDHSVYHEYWTVH